jgi:small subunit ribosomal protein S20
MKLGIRLIRPLLVLTSSVMVLRLPLDPATPVAAAGIAFLGHDARQALTLRSGASISPPTSPRHPRALRFPLQTTDRRPGPMLPGLPERSDERRGLAMANTVSAKKMTRKIVKRTEINRARRSRMRTFVRKVEEAIASGNQNAAAEALHAAEPEIMRAAQKGVVHKNNASRKVSRLAHRIKALSA